MGYDPISIALEKIIVEEAKARIACSKIVAAKAGLGIDLVNTYERAFKRALKDGTAVTWVLTNKGLF